MDKATEIRSLQARAVAIASVKDIDKRHYGGMKLEYDCRTFEDRHKIIGGLDSKMEVEFRAVLAILFDHILFDKLEDPDFTAVMSKPDVDLNKAVRGIDES